MKTPKAGCRQDLLEKQGWTFVAIINPGANGLGAYPEAWVATPPVSHHASKRRFDDYSPYRAVKWAWGQAQAKPLDSGLSGIAAIADLMQKARTTGVIADAADHARVSARPDGHLISLCREALGADRIADRARADWVPPPLISDDGVKFGDRPEYKEHSRRLSEALRLKRQALEALVDLQATTLEGVVAKAKVLDAGPDRARTGKQALAQSLARDVLAVLDVVTAQATGAGGN